MSPTPNKSHGEGLGHVKPPNPKAAHNTAPWSAFFAACGCAGEAESPEARGLGLAARLLILHASRMSRTSSQQGLGLKGGSVRLREWVEVEDVRVSGLGFRARSFGISGSKSPRPTESSLNSKLQNPAGRNRAPNNKPQTT